VPGNHDYYNNPHAEGYFGYFGSQAGPVGRGYYRFDAGSWRVYALTSECARGTRCYIRQYRWLRADLVNNPHQCVLAMWHRPRFSSGAEHGSSTRMAPVFKLLYNKGAEIVLTGHEHDYERFAPTDSDGNPVAKGLRQWVVGTGGAPLYSFASTPLAASEVRNADTHGVLRLDLGPSGYDWQFIATQGSFTDSGSATCH
jgi:3',5'-cyclic AMP phosphodiesterase CpdA